MVDLALAQTNHILLSFTDSAEELISHNLAAYLIATRQLGCCGPLVSDGKVKGFLAAVRTLGGVCVSPQPHRSSRKRTEACRLKRKKPEISVAFFRCAAVQTILSSMSYDRPSVPAYRDFCPRSHALRGNAPA